MEVQDFIDFLFRIGFSDSKWKRELGILREEIADLKEKLIPFDNEELSLLSSTQKQLESIEFSPRQQTIDNILSYAEKGMEEISQPA